jgi:hypothetical protein
VSLIVIVNDPLSGHDGLSRLALSLEREAEVRTYADPHELLSNAAVEPPPDLLITSGHLARICVGELVRRFRTFPACEEVPALIVFDHQRDAWRSLSFGSGVTECVRMRSAAKN